MGHHAVLLPPYTKLEAVGVQSIIDTEGYLEQAEELIRATRNGFRTARALYRRATLLLQKDEPVQAQLLFEQTIRHPACEHSIYDRAATALSTLMAT